MSFNENEITSLSNADTTPMNLQANAQMITNIASEPDDKQLDNNGRTFATTVISAQAGMSTIGDSAINADRIGFLGCTAAESVSENVTLA